MDYTIFSESNELKTKEHAKEELSKNKLKLDICGLETFGALTIKIDEDPLDRWELYGLIPHDSDEDNYYIKSFVISTGKGVYYLRDYFHQALSTIKAIELLTVKEI